jgi:hypothetical protein
MPAHYADQSAVRLACERRDRAFDLSGVALHIDRAQLDAQGSRPGLNDYDGPLSDPGRARFPQDRHACVTLGAISLSSSSHFPAKL